MNIDPNNAKGFSELKRLVRSDLFRENAEASKSEFWRQFRKSLCFRYLFLFRLHKYLRSQPGWRRFVRPLIAFWLNRLSIKSGIHIGTEARIGEGLYMAHHGGIWISGQVVMGNNCNISQGVTLGMIGEGSTKGAPVIGNRVFLGPNAVVAGGFSIGDDATIGANSVVVSDVSERAVMLGVPAKSISPSRAGTSRFIHNVFPADLDGPSLD